MITRKPVQASPEFIRDNQNEDNFQFSQEVINGEVT